jgi:hypothetical protein
MNNSKLNEGLNNGDLRGLVDSTIFVDKHRPKIGTDGTTVVVAFFLKYDDPAKDLSNFIQTSELEHLDVDASDTMNDDGNYTVYVEFSRDEELYPKVSHLLNMIDRITSEKGEWKFTPMGSKEEIEFNEENFMNHVIMSTEEYDARFKKEEKKSISEKIKERINFMVNY